jgi:hypothetical protein
LGYLDLSGPSNCCNGFKEPKMSKQHTAGKRKHLTLTIPEKLEIIRRLQSGES